MVIKYMVIVRFKRVEIVLTLIELKLHRQSHIIKGDNDRTMIGMCHHCNQDKTDVEYKDITLRGKEITILICKECREFFT